MSYAPPDWNFNKFMAFSDSLRNFPVSEQEILGLAYMKSVRDTVVKRGFSYLASFDGRHRSGKSIAATTCAWLWDKRFVDDMENRIVQDHKEFADVLERIDKAGHKGSVIMVDEAGASMSSSDWYENFMKAIAKSIQVLGYLRPFILFVAPVKDFVDARIRKMFHAYYKVDRPKNFMCSYITPYNLHFNTVYKKTFHKKPIVRLMGESRVINRIRLVAPKEILERYAEIELARKPKLMEEFYKDIRQQELQEQKKEFDFEKAVEYIMKNYSMFTSKRSNENNIILDQDIIQVKLRITNRLAKVLKLEAEDKLQEQFRAKAEEKEAKA